MSIFRENRPGKELDDTVEIVRDFNRRAPFWSYRTRAYQIYAPFDQFKTSIDDYLDKLFQGEIDDANGDVLDALIFDLLRQAERDLDRQRTEHRDAITSFAIRAKCDPVAFEAELSALEERLEANKQEQQKKRELLAFYENEEDAYV